MPITSPAAYTLTFHSIALDMVAGTATVVLDGKLGGAQINQVSFVVPDTDLLPILSAMPVAGLSRSDDLGAAIYQYAVAKDYASGAIS